jgi:hypothetical protein
MAQTLKSKITKLAQAYSITAIIETAKEVQVEQADIQNWEILSTDQKTDWFLNQCKLYGLTTRQRSNQIFIEELPEIGKHQGSRAYFTVFLPRNEKIGSNELSDWKLEIGGAYIESINGGIWSTHPGIKGKERQIAEVMRLHKLGQ